MKYNKTIFFLIITFFALNNDKMFGMIPHPTESTTQWTSFETINKLLSTSIDEIERKKIDILTKTQNLKDPISEENVNEIITLWKNLTDSHVSNNLERLFNWHGPALDTLAPLKRKLGLLCHPDKYPNNEQRVTIFKSLEFTPRENPLLPLYHELKHPIAIANIATTICNNILETIHHKQSIAKSKIVHEVNKATTKMECDTLIQMQRTLKLLTIKKAK